MSAKKYIQLKRMNQYVLVATDCLGLGFNDVVDLVVILNPKTLYNLSQLAGRTGRATLRFFCSILNIQNNE